MDAEKSDNSSFEDLSNLKDINKIADEIKSPLTEMAPPVTQKGTEEMAESPILEASETETSRSFQTTQDDNKDNEVKEINVDEKENLAEKDNVDEKNNVDVKNNEDEEDSDDVVDILGNGQLVKRILVKSIDSRRPGRGELVTVSFTGKLDNGTIVEQEENLKFHIGDFEIVQGVDMALPLMNIGEQAEIKVHSRFAYGSLGFKTDDKPEQAIPPNANLTYEVHLVDSVTEDYKDLKSFEVRRTYGTKKKERANFWYNRGEYSTAIQLYRRALDYLDDRDGDPDSDKDDLGYSNADLQKLLEDRLIVYNNLAMAQIKMSAFDAALKSVDHVLRCQPNNAKALYRKGRILDAKGDTKGAISLLQTAATLEKDNRILQQDLAKLMIRQRREENNEKEMYQKMLGQAKKLEQKTKSKKPQSPVDNSKLKMLCYLLGSVLVGVAGAAIYRYKF